MKKAIIFVDANNWYHNVKKLLNPNDVDICFVVDLISKRFDLEIIDIRWYASMPSIADGELMYKKHRNFLGRLEKRGVKVITRKLQRLSNKELIEKRQTMVGSMDLCKHCKPLIESVFLDVAETKKKEKGIDVWIAVDIIKKSIIENECDICVLISGDADFVPALNLVKERGKEILVAMTPLGFSSELIKKFPYFILRREALLKCLRNYKDAKK